MDEISAIQTWLQIGTSTGFVGLAWYLIVVALPKMQERCDTHSERQLREFKEQINEIVQRHEKTVQVLTASHERQIDLIKQIKTCTDK